MNLFTALDRYDPDPNLLYSIEAASQIAHVSRHSIGVYCRYGLVSPVMDPATGGWYFNDEGVRTLRQIEFMRRTYGMNLPAVQLILGLQAEVERLRDEIRLLRRF